MKRPMVHRWSNAEGEHGRRSFLRVYDGDERSELLTGRFERYWGKGAAHTGVGLRGDEDGLQVFVGARGLFSGWLTVGSPALWYPLIRKHKALDIDGREIVEVRVHDGAVWWELWTERWGGRRGVPRWRHGNFNPLNTLLGRHQHSHEVLEGPHAVTVPLPEGSYLVEMDVRRYTWARPRWPRWPFKRQAYSYNAEKVLSEPGYLPVPGKWGADGFFGQSGPLDRPNIHDAVGAVVASVLHERKRKGVAPDYAERIS